MSMRKVWSETVPGVGGQEHDAESRSRTLTGTISAGCPRDAGRPGIGLALERLRAAHVEIGVGTDPCRIVARRVSRWELIALGTRCPAAVDLKLQVSNREIAVAKALHIRLDAKPGKEAEVEQLLEDIYQIIQRGPPTTPWYGFRSSERMFGIFEAFRDEVDREAHLKSKASGLLEERGKSILAKPPAIDPLDLVFFKIGNTMGSPI